MKGLSKTNLENNTQSLPRIPPEVSGLIHKHYDRLLIDDSVSDVNVILLCIYIKDWQSNKCGISYNECKDVFVKLGRKEGNYRQNVYRARKEGLIEVRGEFLYHTSKGLKVINDLLGQVQKTSVYIIKSGRYFSGVKLLEEFLSQQINAEELLVCDPYVSERTLFVFTSLPKKVQRIRILTSNIQDRDKFNGYKERMEKEMGINIDVKISRKIHDRYFVSGNYCWVIGTSLKDIGNKDTIVKEISEVVQSMIDIFEERWKES